MELIFGESENPEDSFEKFKSLVTGDSSFLNGSVNENCIRDFHTSPETNLSMFRYTDSQKYKESQKCMVHKDNGFVTLLPKSTAPGIQVLHNDKWFPMEEFTNENEMLAYFGTATEVFSNYFLPALRHRVVRHPGGIRYSLPFELKALKEVEIVDGVTGSDLEVKSRWQRTRDAVSRIDTVALTSL